MRRKRMANRWGRGSCMRRIPGSILAAVIGLVVAIGTPQPGFAEPEPPSKPGTAKGLQRSRQRAPGFAFGEPRGAFIIKAGLFLPRAASDIYTFNAEQLTLDLNSYNAPMFGLDVAVAVHERVDVVVGFEVSSSDPVSEFRDFVDEFDLPIVQQTRLRQVPITASVRLYLTDRGRSVGNFAWVPATAAPYVGGGGGFTWWRYEQFGDFVDFSDFTIFTDHFLTQGWDPTLHVFGGLDLSVSPRFAVNFEGRYGWAEGQLAPAFTGFQPIDLAGFRATVGAAFRF